MDDFDVLFYCNANSSVGFGHLRRCLFLGEQLVADGKSVAYAGPINEKGVELIGSWLPEADYLEGLNGEEASVGVIDVMYDAHDPEYYDRELIQSVSQSGQNSILLTSSRTAPDNLPVDVVVGHLLGESKRRSFRLKSGFEYAPVDPSVRQWRPQQLRVRQEVDRIFVGFGNWGDPAGVQLALRALHESSFTGRVDVLLPSALLSYEDDFEALTEEANYTAELCHAVPSVPELLVEADLAIGTYGNITYESMGVGTPFLVVAVKPFMVEYGTQLEDNHLAYCAGLVDELTPTDLAQILHSVTSAKRQKYAMRGWRAVDGKGLNRTAQLIRKQIQVSSSSTTEPMNGEDT